MSGSETQLYTPFKDLRGRLPLAAYADRQCRATAKSTGKQCRIYCHPGTVTCAVHGELPGGGIPAKPDAARGRAGSPQD